ncbi:MAG: fumarylacetoacetate hydrolase family protein [Myxococcota bacterium]
MDESRGRIERAAALLCEAEAKRAPIAGLPADSRPRDVAEAYAVQDLFAASLGRPVGYKIAYINPAVQRQLGIPSPMFGRLFEGRVFASPARIAATRFNFILVETEFSFRVSRALPARGRPYAQGEVVEAVGAAIPSFELADTRYTDWRVVAPLDAVADNALGSRWVGGAECADFRGLDLAALEIVTAVNGHEASRGRGANVGGSPLEALAWLANELARMGRGLAQGDRVTTGCCMDVLELAPGDVAEADFGPLGRVRVEFTA